MRLPFESGPNNLLAPVKNALNPLPCASCLRAHISKTILSSSSAIKAEARSRVYWTNVSVAPKNPVDILFADCTGRISHQQVREAQCIFAVRNHPLPSRVSKINIHGRKRDRLMRKY
jgi:hypothetical protein